MFALSVQFIRIVSLFNSFCDIRVTYNSNINHAHFARAGSIHDHQKPIGNALTTLFFNDLRRKLESLGLAFNACVVKTKNLINKIKQVKIKKIRLNYTQRYASCNL